jgi:hypothetical protein
LPSVNEVERLRVAEQPDPGELSGAAPAAPAACNFVGFTGQGGFEFELTGPELPALVHASHRGGVPAVAALRVFIEELNRLRKELREEFDLDKT